MRYFLQAGSGRRYEVEVRELGGGRYRVRLNGRELEAEFADVDRQGQYAARLDSRSYAVAIEERSETDLTVQVAGESFRLTALDQREQAAGAVGAARPARSEIITAAIPGVVLGVRVKVGETVEAGQPVVVLEAMKMQNEIAASQAGVVEEVLVEAGQAVSMGQPLARLRPQAG